VEREAAQAIAIQLAKEHGFDVEEYAIRFERTWNGWFVRFDLKNPPEPRVRGGDAYFVVEVTGYLFRNE